MIVSEGMVKIGEIRIFEDERFRARMVRASGAVVALGLAACAAWYALASFTSLPLPPIEPVAGGTDGVPGVGAWLAALAAGTLAPLGVHELVHAALFKLFAPPGTHVGFGADLQQGMLYAAAEGVVYTRRSYLVIALAPTFVVTACLVGVGAALAWPLWTLVTVSVHLAGCTGDWGYARAIRRDRSIAYCEDASWGVAFFAAAPRETEG